jgi:BirA family biotin operon repressor/biotin-[acetyl-CoA-carboxylase] ligase
MNRASVIGIGINVNIPSNAFPKQLASPATSLLELCGRPLDRSELTRLLLQRLDQLYQVALSGEPESIWWSWRQRTEAVT